MSKLVTLSILIAIVYSWEDLKRFLWMIIRSKARNKNTTRSLHLDQFVATVLMFVSLPISLMYFLTSEIDLGHKLIFIAVELLLISILAWSLGIFLNRLRLLKFASGAEKIGVVAYSVMGLVSPGLRWVDPWNIERRLIAKFTLFLSIPALVGLALKQLVNWSPATEALPNLDFLIQIAVAGLMINVTVEFLERHMRRHRWVYLSAYLRIVLGIAIGFALIRGLN